MRRFIPFFLLGSLFATTASAGERIAPTHARGMVVSADAWEFRGWRSDAGDVVVARRAPGQSYWDAVVVDTNPGEGKTDKVVVGVSQDGVVHVAYDVPGSIRYQRTTTGVANASHGRAWAQSDFRDAATPNIGRASTASVSMFARHGGGPLTLTYKEYDATRSMVQQATWDTGSWQPPVTLATMGFRVVSRDR